MEGAVAFGVTNVASASGYALDLPLGGALANRRADALSYPFLTVVYLMTLLFCGGWLESLRLESRRACFGDLLILLDSARAHADGADDYSVAYERYAPGKYD
jgi:hypothetical protein